MMVFYFFIDCDDDNLNAERRLLENVELEIGNLSMGSLTEVFNRIPIQGKNSGLTKLFF